MDFLQARINYFSWGGGGRMLCSLGCLLSQSMKIIKFNKKIETNVISSYVQNIAVNFDFEIQKFLLWNFDGARSFCFEKKEINQKLAFYSSLRINRVYFIS